MNYDYIDRLLKEKGMSRRQLAIQAGISVNNMSGWFRRRTIKVPDRYIEAIADILGINYLEIKYTDKELDDLREELSPFDYNSLYGYYETKKNYNHYGKIINSYSTKQLIDDFNSLPIAFQHMVIMTILKLKDEAKEL